MNVFLYRLGIVLLWCIAPFAALFLLLTFYTFCIFYPYHAISQFNVTYANYYLAGICALTVLFATRSVKPLLYGMMDFFIWLFVEPFSKKKKR